MTTAEILELLKDRLGNTRGLSDALLYRYLTRARKYAEDHAPINFVAAVGVKTTIGDIRFDLTDPAVFDILTHPDDATELCTIRSVENVQYYIYPSLRDVPYKIIRSVRQNSGNGSGWPYMYSLTRPSDTPTLEIYPAAAHTVTTFLDDDVKLALDVNWRTPDINADLNPMTPSYADDFIFTYAAYLVQSQNGDQRAGLAFAEAKNLWKAVKNTANKESSGRAQLGWLK